MTNILMNNKRYDLLDFESEDEFEKAVVDNSKLLFGKDGRPFKSHFGFHYFPF